MPVKSEESGNNERKKKALKTSCFQGFLVCKDYEKDICDKLAYEFELSQFLVKSFAYTHGEMKSTHSPTTSPSRLSINPRGI